MDSKIYTFVHRKRSPISCFSRNTNDGKNLADESSLAIFIKVDLYIELGNHTNKDLVKNYSFSFFVRFLVAAIWLPLFLWSAGLQAQIHVEGGAQIFVADSATVAFIKDPAVIKPQTEAKLQTKAKAALKPAIAEAKPKADKKPAVKAPRAICNFTPKNPDQYFASGTKSGSVAVTTEQQDLRFLAVLPSQEFLNFQQILSAGTPQASRQYFYSSLTRGASRVRPPPAIA